VGVDRVLLTHTHPLLASSPAQASTSSSRAAKAARAEAGVIVRTRSRVVTAVRVVKNEIQTLLMHAEVAQSQGDIMKAVYIYERAIATLSTCGQAWLFLLNLLLSVLT
jgi:hypothetical protein